MHFFIYYLAYIVDPKSYLIVPFVVYRFDSCSNEAIAMTWLLLVIDAGLAYGLYINMQCRSAKSTAALIIFPSTYKIFQCTLIYDIILLSY